MNLEWDADKAVQNLLKHGVSFDDATLVFLDPARIESYDGREDYGEDRWITVGAALFKLLTVAYTVREEETLRIISAREAAPNEQRQYRQANT